MLTGETKATVSTVTDRYMPARTGFPVRFSFPVVVTGPGSGAAPESGIAHRKTRDRTCGSTLGQFCGQDSPGAPHTRRLLSLSPKKKDELQIAWIAQILQEKRNPIIKLEQPRTRRILRSGCLSALSAYSAVKQFRVPKRRPEALTVDEGGNPPVFCKIFLARPLP
jgi:hypothetical protein